MSLTSRHCWYSLVISKGKFSIIYVGKVIKNFNLPILIGLIQTSTVSLLSVFGAILFEEINIDGIFKQTYQILYAGILSGGFAFVLQIYAQKNITPTPAAIIFSLEGVIATIAAWILLSQILNIDNIIGCIFIILFPKFIMNFLLKIFMKPAKQSNFIFLFINSFNALFSNIFLFFVSKIL